MDSKSKTKTKNCCCRRRILETALQDNTIRPEKTEERNLVKLERTRDAMHTQERNKHRLYKKLYVQIGQNTWFRKEKSSPLVLKTGIRILIF